ncbi:Sugar transferase involved in LPS biosynthesis (colanic, teichoic acid) [Flavobacterium johnsoniae]|uniref:Sugar transferase involved in LPS biosynthesis (Colanic, teichoic acid) n=1 Tax=Flavobacterium johnsoniae TaxID=986 RepID=A0A1M5L3Q4_FLAJO|nr:Sugar transferase involved in LPS biosynthesis (colanic, teichoic acid) [Flavobacterium johnsoniae]
MIYNNFIKRLLDLVFSFVGLILLSPLFFIVFISLFFLNQGRPFFTQLRPGKKEKIFKIIKFRTMNNKTDSNGVLLSDSERLTSVGSFIRKTSLDEIPQLLNVLKGDMSLIGPRPLLPEYLQLYNDFQKQRHNIRPGITGWAQVNGRNAILWQEKFELDVYYVNNLSVRLDLRIIFLTIKKVFKSEGISQKGQATMEYFKGN